MWVKWRKKRGLFGGIKVTIEKGTEGDSVGGGGLIKYWQMYENAIIKPIILYASLKLI